MVILAVKLGRTTSLMDETKTGANERGGQSSPVRGLGVVSRVTHSCWFGYRGFPFLIGHSNLTRALGLRNAHRLRTFSKVNHIHSTELLSTLFTIDARRLFKKLL